ncbi:hypothetical protein CPB83DRAFT_847574 [Crepidotus variabilis]|uniref:Uncharacterized protein n=1 Tax=Crepidotus variabilis TaxID=179855 RepID=A0A9P6JTY7_9AGAR|nr:hypothetical protein CPB83DRAFT_847574 [Crepidotus variabilis]
MITDLSEPVGLRNISGAVRLVVGFFCLLPSSVSARLLPIGAQNLWALLTGTLGALLETIAKWRAQQNLDRLVEAQSEDSQLDYARTEVALRWGRTLIPGGYQVVSVEGNYQR